MIAENDKMTAATAVQISWPQNPKVPNRLKYLDVLSNLFETYDVKHWIKM